MMSGLLNKTRRVFWIILVFSLLAAVSGCRRGEKKEFTGEFYANDCSESHGGFEWAGSYLTSLVVRGTKGDLTMTFLTGLGDPLTRHEFSISDFAEAAGRLSFKIEGKAATLVFVEQDTIWDGRYNGFYIGNNSIKEEEQVGSLPIEPFSGFPSHYYVELRLKSINPPSALFLTH